MLKNNSIKSEIKKTNLSRSYKSYKDGIKKHFDKLAESREKWIRKASGFYEEDILMMREFVPENSRILEPPQPSGSSWDCSESSILTFPAGRQQVTKITPK